MLTLRDIDSVTEYSDGSAYSDMYKYVYGSRPRGSVFATIEDFNQDYDFIAKQYSDKLDEEKSWNIKNFEKFVARINETKELVQGINNVRAIEIIADAENELQSMQWYGYESLEFTLGLEYGSIQKWLDTQI